MNQILRALIVAVALVTPALAAESIFPGLQSIMTDNEWKRSGLNRLSPDEIGVIDAALIRHLVSLQNRAPSPPPTAAAPNASTSASSAPASAPLATTPRPGLWERFGLSARALESDWRSQPPLVAKVTTWQGSNAFVLENGQVWEGLETIPFELPGREVTIEARPGSNFALRLDEHSAVIRVRRIK